MPEEDRLAEQRAPQGDGQGAVSREEHVLLVAPAGQEGRVEAERPEDQDERQTDGDGVGQKAGREARKLDRRHGGDDTAASALAAIPVTIGRRPSPTEKEALNR